MKIVIQRVLESSVSVSGEVVSQIGRGLSLLVCLEKDDQIQTLEKAAKKVLALRVFSDDQGRMNENILQVKGEILAVSQFTLSWNGQKGNRPSFDNSMAPQKAEEYFNQFCQILEKEVPVKRGVFGESMQVHIVNDGPVTFSLNF